jgi:hypothetical protein
VNAAVAAFVVSQMLAVGIWKYTNIVLIDTLEHFYKQAHGEAGAPETSFVADPATWNGHWATHILLMRFRRAMHPTPHLRWAYWLAFASGWYVIFGLLLLGGSFLFGGGRPPA